jgi:nitrate reductase cytochrome c-type subunit
MMLSREKIHKTRIKMYLLALVVVMGAALVSCRVTDSPTPSPEVTVTSVEQPTLSPSPTATEKPRATMTDSPTSTPEATPTAVLEVGTEGQYVHENLTSGDVGTNEYPSSPPGSSEVLEREYPGAPALIPHSIIDLELTKDRNDCVSCHIVGVSFGTDHTATKIPESHFIDVLTGESSETVQGTRYYCLLCHMSQSTETPLR